MQIQVFGTRKSQDTHKALRFFSERRITTHFVDLKQKGISPRELQRFTQKFGVQAIIDVESRQYRDLGLRHAALSERRWVETLLDDPLLLRTPLVRYENRVTVGLADEEWLGWVGR